MSSETYFATDVEDLDKILASKEKKFLKIFLNIKKKKVRTFYIAQKMKAKFFTLLVSTIIKISQNILPVQIILLRKKQYKGNQNPKSKDKNKAVS